jgi:outer membrane protein assembly factor BamD
VKRLILLLALAGAVGCASSGEPDIATLASNSDQLIWEAGQKAFEKKQWENARQHFRRIIEGFPQSQYGPAARLALADSYFAEGGSANYILAFSQYREFVALYPSHPKSDYAQIQTGECHFRQRNGADRDQTPNTKALEEYQRLLELYPSSPYAEKARERIRECRQSLARAEFLAGYFYQRTRKAWRAAISRYEQLLKDYPDYPGLDEVLYRLSECLVQAKRAGEALPRLKQLIEEYPQSPRAPAAQRLSEEVTRTLGTDPPPPPPPTPPAVPKP